MKRLGEDGLDDEKIIDTFDNLEFIKTNHSDIQFFGHQRPK